MAIKDNPFVACVCRVVARNSGLVVLEPVGQPLCREHSLDECEVGFPVLGKSTMGAQGLGEVHAPIGLRVVREDAIERCTNVDVLKQAAVASMVEQCEPGFYVKAISCEAAI